MEMKEMEYIIAIAEEGSISRAAERLYMAQSSLSQFLAKYEAELQVKLFMRTASGVRLTYSGEVFVQNARQMLRQYQQMKGELSDIKQLRSGRIEFGISSFRGSYLLPSVLRQFREQYPGVEVVIHEHDSYKLRELLENGRLDMALLALHRNLPAREHAAVMQEEVYIVARQDHPVMAYVHHGDGGPKNAWVDFADAAQFEFLLSNRNTVLGGVAMELFGACGKEPIATNTNLTAAFAASMARVGLGLALTYRACAVPKQDVVYLSIGKKRTFVNLVLEYPASGYRSHATRALEELIRKNLSDAWASSAGKTESSRRGR